MNEEYEIENEETVSRIFIYLFLFYHEILHVFHDKSLSKMLTSAWSYVRHTPSLVDPALGHACTSSPSHIREEVDLFVADLSSKFKHALFAALSVGYFAVYVPCCFAPVSDNDNDTDNSNGLDGVL